MLWLGNTEGRHPVRVDCKGGVSNLFVKHVDLGVDLVFKLLNFVLILSINFFKPLLHQFRSVLRVLYHKRRFHRLVRSANLLLLSRLLLSLLEHLLVYLLVEGNSIIAFTL